MNFSPDFMSFLNNETSVQNLYYIKNIYLVKMAENWP